MGHIILIATVHTACGLCNQDQLYRIIEQIAPDVIFEEVPPHQFKDIYQGLRKDSLETSTIKLYLQNYSVAHHPVDLDTPEMNDKAFRNECSTMFNTFSYHSDERTHWSNERERLAGQLGFSYLNSEACSALMERIHLLEASLVQKFNHEKLSQVHNTWLNIVERRRNEMIKNIYKYMESGHYKKALFLVGAEHRKSVMQKVADYPELKWNFNYFGEL